LHQCCGDKATGPNGVAMAFIQDNWDILKVDIMRMPTQFHSTGKSVKSFHATFIGLTPKKSSAHDIGDYRPINLVGCVYRLLSKILAAKFRGVVARLISDNQNTLLRLSSS